jgi:hypothetical protein
MKHVYCSNIKNVKIIIVFQARDYPEYGKYYTGATMTDSMTRSTDLTAMKPINPEAGNNLLNKRRDSRRNNNRDPVDDSENLNPEEVHKSLRLVFAV